MWRRWWPARPGVFRGLARTRRPRSACPGLPRSAPRAWSGSQAWPRPAPRSCAPPPRGRPDAQVLAEPVPAKLDRLFLLANSEQFGIQEQHFHPTTCPDSVAVWQER